MVELTDAEYQALVKDQEFLRRLEAAGVDNWEGYEDACALHADDDEE